MDEPVNVCKFCHQPLSPEWYFCANCGKEINGKPARVPVISQIGIYALSILLPPLGLVPGINYLRKDGRQAKIVGAVALALTLISTAVSIWLIFDFLQIYLSTFNSVLNTGIPGL